MTRSCSSRSPASRSSAFCGIPARANITWLRPPTRFSWRRKTRWISRDLRVEAVFIKNTFDKLGIHADVIHAGKYKDAGDILTQTSMTPETREVLDQILDQYYGNLIDTVAQGRKKQLDAVRAMIDQGPFMANEALGERLD